MAEPAIKVENARILSAPKVSSNNRIENIKRNILISVILILILLVAGAFIYHTIEGWSWLDSVYFMTITFTTIGYGDFYPKTTYGKLFTIVIIWAGVSTAFFLLYNITAYRETIFDTKIEAELSRLNRFLRIKK